MAKLAENLGLLESTRAETLGLVRGLSQEQMDWAPAPGKWSTGEILDHLLKSEGIYRKEIQGLIDLVHQGKTPFVRRGVAEIDFSPNFLPKSMLPLVDIPFTFMTMFVPPVMRDLMIRYSSVMGGQSPKAAEPRRARPATELVTELESAIAATATVLRSNPGLPYQRMRLQHPLLGVNDVPQLLRLTAMHEKRHQDQIRTIRAAMPAPAQAA